MPRMRAACLFSVACQQDCRWGAPLWLHLQEPTPKSPPAWTSCEAEPSLSAVLRAPHAAVGSKNAHPCVLRTLDTQVHHPPCTCSAWDVPTLLCRR